MIRGRRERAVQVQEAEGRLVVDAARVDPGGETLVGEVAAVDLDEAFVRAVGAVRYRLTAQVFGAELLVRGRLEQDFDLVCCRCGKDFDDTVKVEDFAQSFEIPERTAEVDLTEEIRESIILALPTYPVCAEACPGIANETEIPQDDRWCALDGLSAR